MDETSLLVAFGAGVLSFLSPCVLPLVPVYLANLAGASSVLPQTNRWPPVLHTLCFVLGFSLVFIGLGASAGLIGAVFSGVLLRKIAGALLIGFGIFLIASRWVPWLNYEIRLGRMPGGSAGYLRSVLVGAAFSLGWTPCVGATLGGILTLASSSQTVWRGIYLLAAYSLGLGVPFIAAGLALGTAVPIIRWLSRRGNIILPLSGLLLIAVGILMLTNTLMRLSF
jgi:cytochrome c-type biogenesis protein